MTKALAKCSGERPVADKTFCIRTARPRASRSTCPEATSSPRSPLNLKSRIENFYWHLITSFFWKLQKLLFSGGTVCNDPRFRAKKLYFLCIIVKIQTRILKQLSSKECEHYRVFHGFRVMKWDNIFESLFCSKPQFFEIAEEVAKIWLKSNTKPPKSIALKLAVCEWTSGEGGQGGSCPTLAVHFFLLFR